MGMEDRIASEASAIIPVTNDNLICKDCTHRGGKVVFCSAYMDDGKPNLVLKGGTCRYYKKE